MNGSCSGSFDGELGSLIRNEAANLISRFGPNAPSGTKPRNKLRVAGCLLSEIGRPHSGVSQEGIYVFEQSVRVGHDAKLMSALADSQQSSKAFVQSHDKKYKFQRMETLSPQDDGWRERLKAAIDASGRSQGDIALSCGLSRGYFTNIFRDGKEPTIGNLILIAREINVSLSKIIYGYDVSPETEEILALLEGNPDLRDGILKILSTQSKP